MYIVLYLFTFLGIWECSVRSTFERAGSRDKFYSFLSALQDSKSAAGAEVVWVSKHLANFQMVLLAITKFNVIGVNNLIAFFHSLFSTVCQALFNKGDMEILFVTFMVNFLGVHHAKNLTVGDFYFYEIYRMFSGCGDGLYSSKVNRFVAKSRDQNT